MQVVIDGEVFHTQPPGGIARTYMEILPRMVALAPDVAWTVSIPFTRRRLVPRRGVRQVLEIPEAAFGRSTLWRRLARRLNGALLRRAVPTAAIWHSTYYTSPPRAVKGVVGSVYDLIYEHEHGTPHHLHATCARESDLLIFTTRSVRDEFCELFEMSQDRTVIIPLAASAVFRPVGGDYLPANSPRPFYLYIGGRSNAYKNFVPLLRAYGAWPGRHEVDLVVVGSPWMPSEEALLDELRLRGRVHLRGPVDDAELCRLYNAARAFIYPSRCEGFGIPLLEAMACECQIIASRIPTTCEVAGAFPIYFDPDDAESLIAALQTALDKPRDAASRRAGRERATGEFSWDRTARQTLGVYRQLAEC